MTLTFPNPSRSYDETRHSIRFSGYDGVFEIEFLVEIAALPVQFESTADGEVDYLCVFDRFRRSIENVAREIYTSGRKNMYLLKAADFR